jgi:hypothetical protein
VRREQVCDQLLLHLHGPPAASPPALHYARPWASGHR